MDETKSKSQNLVDDVGMVHFAEHKIFVISGSDKCLAKFLRV